MIWHANISRGGMDVYQPSFRSAVKESACDIAMSAVSYSLPPNDLLTAEALEGDAVRELVRGHMIPESSLANRLARHQEARNAACQLRRSAA